MVQQIDAELIIDRKDFSGDKFDDLKLKMPNGNTEFQIKYSDEEKSHKLTKDDLANGNGQYYRHPECPDHGKLYLYSQAPKTNHC